MLCVCKLSVVMLRVIVLGVVLCVVMLRVIVLGVVLSVVNAVCL
jgi:hypothetical protein